ncbi:AAA-like domain-containing protein [Sorangium sp. So ce726]|uniref:AAA-like domain-containing protein n=1 Tax=Sorangium sp. So ce726 TaxID=3133319 RepID=UPI003F5FA842
MLVPLQPPGTPYRSAWYVARPHEEQLALNYLEYGQPVLLWGPRRQGRTWLWTHISEQWRAAANDFRQVAVVYLHTFDADAFTDLDACLRAFAIALLEALDDSIGTDAYATVEATWSSLKGDPKRKINDLLARTILRLVPGPLLLIIDRADLVVGRPFYNDFSGLLRGWAESSVAKGPWKKLRLLVSVSTPPARLSTEVNQSFFYNLSDPIEVMNLERAQIAELADRHGLQLSDADLDRLMSLAGGHPYLVRAVLFDLAGQRYTLVDLASGAPLGRSLAADHLYEHRTRLNASPELGQAFASLAKDPATRVDGKTLDALIRQGLVQQGERGTHPVRYRIYERLLQTEPAVAPVRRRLRLFYSYAAMDEALRERLDVHLKLLERQGLIEPWYQQRLLPGSVGRAEIDRHLDEADLVLLLVSPDFLASDECWDAQMTRALARHEIGKAKVVPLLLRPCDWVSAPFAKLTPLPRDRIPVTRWTDPDDAWANVAHSLRQLITEWPGEGARR